MSKVIIINNQECVFDSEDKLKYKVINGEFDTTDAGKTIYEVMDVAVPKEENKEKQVAGFSKKSK